MVAVNSNCFGWQSYDNKLIHFIFCAFAVDAILYVYRLFWFVRQDERQVQAGQKWKLPPNGQPICSFSGSEKQTRTAIRPEDDSKWNCFFKSTIFIRIVDSPSLSCV